MEKKEFDIEWELDVPGMRVGNYAALVEYGDGNCDSAFGHTAQFQNTLHQVIDTVTRNWCNAMSWYSQHLPKSLERELGGKICLYSVDGEESILVATGTPVEAT